MLPKKAIPSCLPPPRARDDMASSSNAVPPAAPNANATLQGNGANAHAIITALGNAFKTQGGPMDNAQIAKLLQTNLPQLGQLAKEGKLNQQQILQVRSSSIPSPRDRAANPVNI